MRHDTTLPNSLSKGRTPWRAALLLAGTLTLGGTIRAQVVFNESFTGGASTAGFTITQSDGTCGWAYGNPGSRTITGAGFDADFVILDNDYCGNIGSSTGELLSPVFDATSASNFILTFDQSYRYCCSSVATVDVWDGTTWNNVYTLPDASVGYNNPAVPESFNITAAANGSTAAQIRFQYTGDYAYWWALDNIVLTGVDCIAPDGLTVTGLTTDGGTIGWTDNGSAGYSWAVTTGAMPDGTNEVDEGDGSITTITGLSSNTSYTAWVRADCGDGSFSPWAPGVSFHTPCDATEIPYSEDFNATVTPAIPECMSTQTVSGNTWRTVTAVGTMTGHSANITYTSAGSPAMDTWLYTQGLNLTGGTSYQLTYKYFTNGTFYHESMSVAYGTAANETSMTNALADHPSIATTTVQIDTINFTPATSGTYYVGFKCYSIADQNQLYLDDILVIVTPECYPPIASTWIAPDCDNSQYYVHVALTNLGDATSVDIMSDAAGNPGGLTGITTAGDYMVGPFPDLSTVNITVVHNDNATCNLDLGPVTFDCSDDGKNALSFDGVDDRVDCGSGTSLDITGNAVTMEAWIYPTAWKTSTFQANIVNSEGGNTGYMLRCGDNGKLDFNLGDGAGFHQMISPANTLTLNTWQYVAGTYDGDTMRMYLNGVQIMAQQGTFNIGATGTNMVIGDWSNGTGRNFPGKIDEVRVWSTAVSGANILAHMNTAYCGNETGLVAYYKFDQGIANGANPTETTLNDLTSYANNGTLTGFTLDGASSNWVVGVTDMGDCVPVACPAPTAVAITNPTDNGFDISWTDTGAPSYQYEVRSSGAPGSGVTGLEASGSPVSGTPAITISGLAPNATYSVYVLAACGVGNLSDWSPPASLYLGYCIPAPTSVDNNGITNVTFGGVNNTTGEEPGHYGDYTSMVGTVQQSTLASVNITFETGYTYGTKIWVDLNNDLDFDDTDELVYTGLSTNANPTTLVATFPVGTMPLGQHRMRIGGTDNDAGPSTPCYTGSYGTFEDYTLQVDPAPSCITPTALTLTGVTTTTADLSWTASASDPADGYQWEVRSSGTPGSGVTGLADNGSTAAGVTTDIASGLISDTDYMFYVRSVCGAGDTSAWSIPASLHTGYCLPAGNNTSYYINDFSTTGGLPNISNSGTGYSTNGYGNFTSQSVSQSAGQNIDFNAVFGSDGNTFHFRIWVDWNNDLDFDDGGELMFDGTTYQTSYTGSFTVPTGTAPGDYRMRIRNTYTGTPLPCGTSNGETEDYTVTVFVPADCSGLPDPGATTGPSVICADVPFTLAVENNTTDAGITYQWQTSPDGSAWSDAPGASTAATYATSQTVDTWYRLQVTCEFGDVATSTPLEITMAPYTECYCASNFTNVTYEHITNVTYAGIDNTSAGIVGGPVNYTDQTAEVDPGDTHTMSVTILADQLEYIYVFIDWNQNGILNDADEVYTVASSVEDVGPFTLDIVTPADAVPGNTRMRVMLAYNNAIPNPCVSQTYGEAEDYTVHVSGTVDCEGVANGPALPGTACVSDNGLDGVWSAECVCVENEVVDCEGVAGGPALPGTPCYDTPNGWGGTWSAECVCDLNIGVGEIASTTGFAIYPNPASSVLYITTPNGRPVHVKVYDMVGTLVIDKDMVQQLDITTLATGSYTLVATDAKGGNEQHARFMKQ